MSFKLIHKWVFSLALLASVFSFAGNATVSLTNNGNSIELVIVKKIDNKASDFQYTNFNQQLNSCFEFSFKTLLNYHNALSSLKFEDNSEKALHYSYYNHFIFLKFSTYKDDYHNIFIG